MQWYIFYEPLLSTYLLRFNLGTVASQPAKQQRIDAKEKMKEGFARGLQAEKIIGIRKDKEKLFFLVKWKGTEDRDFVDSKAEFQRRFLDDLMNLFYVRD